MEEALKFAMILTEKHKVLSDSISKFNHFSNQKEARKKQTEITLQMIDFLNDLQDVKEILFLNSEYKSQYYYLLNYYSKYIYIRIEQFQQKINLLQFESKFTNSLQAINPMNNNEENVEKIQNKLNSYYNLIQK